MKAILEKNNVKLQYILAFLFLGLCSLHFFSARPTWLDENFVLESLKFFDYNQIFGVLKREQAFPRVHLLLIKLISSPFDYHVYSLRFISFISMLAAGLVWFKIYRRYIKEFYGVLICIWAFICSYRLVYYAAELKSYSMDVLAVGLFTAYILHQGRLKAQNIGLRDYAAVILLPFLNLLGYATFFIFWMVCYNFILMTIRDRRFFTITAVSCIAALCSVIALYFTDLQFVLHSNARQQYWYSYFICYENAGCFFSTFGEGIKRLVTFWFGNSKLFVQASVVFIPFTVFAALKYGFSMLWRDKGKVTGLESLGLALLGELFVFGVMHRYPFTGDRVTLYLAPFMFYFIYRGLNAIKYNPVRLFMLGYYLVFCGVCLINTLIAQIRLY